MTKKLNFDFSKTSKSPAKNFVIGGLAVLSALYLINPTFGIFEILPDNLPFVGNLDEFTMGMILLNSLEYFDIDLLSFFSGNKNKTPEQQTSSDQPIYEPPNKS